MSNTLSLAQMVDLALGTPEVGAVNFNVLHTLLHSVLQNLNIADALATINPEDRDFLTKQTAPGSKESASPGAKDTDVTSSSKADEDGKPTEVPAEKSKSAPMEHVQSSPYHQLQKKVSDIEKQLDALNSLPSNDALFERARARTSDDRADKARPVSDMWQQMQLAKRVDANEAGIGKLMSLVEDMMGEVNDLKSLKDLQKELQALKDMYEDIKKQIDQVKDLSDINKKFKEMEDMLKAMQDQMNQFPTMEDLGNLVTWEGLENALKGVKEDLKPPPPAERIVIEMSSQTESRPASRPASRPPSSTPSRKLSTPGPSSELVDVLERLGKLTDQHDALEERVTAVEEELKNKADKDALDAISVPDDLLNQLKAMQEDIDRLKKNREKESDALTRMQQAILNLQAELERLSNTTQEILEDSAAKQKQIKALYEITDNLQETKADKEFVHNEVEVKADKRHLDGKVNRSTFDSTCDELNKMINDILGKLAGHQDDWRKALEQLAGDLDGKLDRLEFGPFRDELEKQLRALKNKLKGLDLNSLMFDSDDAAGLRKQMLRFNCISCDRPVEMAPQGPIPSIPAQSGLPANKSARPYTTFELDQIRQHARSFPNPNMEVMDLYATNRSCGGSHTLTYPHKRMTRVTHMNTLFREEEVAVPPGREEQDIQGADGHIYKGRADGRLPAVPAHAGVRGPVPTEPGITPKPPKRAATNITARVASPRPASARLTNRPQSARVEFGGEEPPARPQSAAGGRLSSELDSGVRLPPAPAPSEPDPEPAPRTPSPRGRDDDDNN